MSLRTVPHAGGKSFTILQPAGASDSDRAAFAASVRSGLLGTPKTLPWPYFYDEQGSRLFDQICELPEYYLTRTEDALLQDHADALVAGWESAPTLVELGSGSATKTRRLIGAALRRYGTLHYVPIDVSPTFIEDSAAALVRAFPSLRVTGHVGDYRSELQRVAERLPGPKLLIFLGSSLGNYEPDDASSLLRQLAWTLNPADRFLLGADLDKDPAVLEAAYDDAQGVTAAFNLNLLARINRELGGNFDLDRFAHQARYDPQRRRIEMHLVSLASQTVTVPGARVTATFAEGESIHTENSHKYTPDGLRAMAAAAGLEEEAAWTDARGFFRLQRWRLSVRM
ncbi:MAG: L-histidine N(alpha)-methyltransferase [Isosphaeraceae bacterium]|nr:L-histidine N(alpha)-methyltransferase [Isosphaeraceae bacterium]